MSLIRDFVDRIRSKRAHPVIHSRYGDVTESMRHQAAINMRADPACLARVVNMIKLAHNLTDEQAIIETKRRYPEAFE